ncbi:TRAF-like family protein [Rhynchospora pubera]|uniref:TRAF-like family protein n=1 Tax=Rhynchospora pubera TaxID=906938 RepID=A0AAV8EBC5_9POAL|nr:TRAF-like family protein [Rhynchospora pubera]
MGSSHSSHGRKAPKTPSSSVSEQQKEKTPDQKHVFVWNIDGFSSLLEQGEGFTNTPFKMHGIAWNLAINPMDRNTGDTEKHLSLVVCAYVKPDCMLETEFKFFIRAQKYGHKHVEREVSHTYMTSSYRSGVKCMIPLETLKNPSAGFLWNDTLAVGVELIKFKKVHCNGELRRSSITSIQKNKPSESFSWFVEDFSQLDKPVAFSKPFRIAGYTWRLKLKPEGEYNNDFLALYLDLDNSASQLLPSSGVMVNFVLSIKKSESTAYAIRLRYNFTGKDTSFGMMDFIRQVEFKDPANGYLIKGRCTFEASISIFGSANDHLS